MLKTGKQFYHQVCQLYAWITTGVALTTEKLPTMQQDVSSYGYNQDIKYRLGAGTSIPASGKTEVLPHHSLYFCPDLIEIS